MSYPPVRMCRLALLLSSLAFAAVASADNAPQASKFPFQDATTILQLAQQKGGLDQIKSMLAAYGVASPADNPFLKQVTFLQTVRQIGVPSGGSIGAAEGGIPGSIFSATNVANALATVIAERVKQDAEILALEALSRQISRINQDQRYSGPVDKLLPATTQYLEKWQPSAADPSMWSTLQASFRRDLQALPNTTLPFLQSLTPPDTVEPFDRYFVEMAAELGVQIAANNKQPYGIIDALADTSSAIYARQPGLRLANLTALQQRINGENTVLQGLPKQELTAQQLATQQVTAKALAADTAQQQSLRAGGTVRQFQVADAAFQGLTILSHALAQDRTSKWHTAQDLDAYLRTAVMYMDSNGNLVAGNATDTVYLLFGLSYALDASRYKAIAAAASPDQTADAALATLIQWVQVHLAKVDALEQAADQFQTALAKIQNDMKPLTDTLKKDYQLPDLQALITDLGGLGSSVCTTLNTFAPAAAGAGAPADATTPCTYLPQIQTWEKNLYTLTGIYSSARAGDYPAAIAALVVVIPDILPGELDPTQHQEPGILVFIQQKGPLIASLAAATKPDDFSAALDQYALPAGSFTQIQNEPHSWTLNAYFGGEVGAEVLTGNLSGTTAHHVAPRIGFAAPVGIAYNWGDPRPTSTPLSGWWHLGSQSVFLSALDVGAVASFRLEHGNSGQVAAFKWSNIVAPGLFYVWTLRNTPLSFMVGTQYGPELRQVSTTSGDTLQRAAWQPLVLGVTFNIPLFQLSSDFSSSSAH